MEFLIFQVEKHISFLKFGQVWVKFKEVWINLDLKHEISIFFIIDDFVQFYGIFLCQKTASQKFHQFWGFQFLISKRTSISTVRDHSKFCSGPFVSCSGIRYIWRFISEELRAFRRKRDLRNLYPRQNLETFGERLIRATTNPRPQEATA